MQTKTRQLVPWREISDRMPIFYLINAKTMTSSRTRHSRKQNEIDSKENILAASKRSHTGAEEHASDGSLTGANTFQIKSHSSTILEKSLKVT
jgi:hypothetical protein